MAPADENENQELEASGPAEEEKKEKLDAEWDSMAEGGEDSEGGSPSKEDESSRDATRVLNQDEIDSLLGFDEDADGQEKTGMQAILSSALVSYERLPMLEVVFDRLVRLMSGSLRNFTSDNVEV